MQRVFVLSNAKKPLMPCNPARARRLLKRGKAKVFRRIPFTILLTERKNGETQKLELKFDPGSKTTGIAIVSHGKQISKCIWAANLEHRGNSVRNALESKRASRRSRRGRKTRYRKPRFLNRIRPKGWLAPSLMSRVNNVNTWRNRIQSWCPVTSLTMELVKFDTQKMQNAEISGVEYQQGELSGYEVREYLLEKFGRKCVYCDAKDIPLEIEHVIPKSKGGSDRVSNLTIACNKCNQKKNNKPVEEFLKDKPNVLNRLSTQLKSSLKDTAAVNSTIFKTLEVLKSDGLKVSCSTGSRTKYNRIKQDYPKAHWVDAACVSESGENIFISKKHKPLLIKAMGRGSRQMCRVDKYGFPRTTAKKQKMVKGFQTGDIVLANVPSGKKKGVYQGRVAVRTSGSFNIKTNDTTVQGIGYRYCKLIQRTDGYLYN
ncbi:RNA-guided endonuclease IscB [Xanthovirga aplysinae]|uniref:RNA-guided endonuclease IscB n=1 Tax=Xanthovirga aplysinae TaxID=2529853 RepID=UPI0012BC2692|nr:RNA-guided endonuclease IscB [Xanthovirga aplysinae]MTI31425.1 HNH endonuclease [Xanthovirga aplysinae]